MAAPSLDVDWIAIKDAAITGVPMGKLAELHGISYHTIQKRAKRFAWPLPHIVQRATEALSGNVRNERESGQIATKHAAQSLAELGETGAIMGAKLLHGLLKRAVARPGKLRGLLDAGDVATAVRGLNAATGREAAGASVTLNLGLLAGGSRGQVEVLDVSSESQE